MRAQSGSSLNSCEQIYESSCGMQMRLEVWQPDLQLVFRDHGELALQLSEDPPFKRRSLPRASSALRTLYKQIGYARPQGCSCAIRCYVTVESTSFFPGACRGTQARMYYELAGYGLVLGRRNLWRGRRGGVGEEIAFGLFNFQS